MGDSSVRPPHDQAVRDVVGADLADTLFVEAGAGSGKTTVLVNRVCALVESGVDVRAIAAITFTEKAASELRVRVRQKLAGQPRTPVVEAALAALGDAPMSTLHAFARRVLTEHGVSVGVPPRFEVLDTVAEAIYLEERWRKLASELFDESGPLAAVVTRAAELGLRPAGLREIVVALHQSYDRLRGGGWEWPTSPVTVALIDLARLTDAIRVAPFGDRPEVAEYLARAIGAETEGEAIDVLRTEGVLPRKAGKLGEPARVLIGVAAELRRDALTALVPALAATVLQWADERAAEGRLLFHDLLVLARDSMRDADVRAACRDRYQRVLIDEFQDTDPLQVEIAVLLASSRDDIASREWSDDPLDDDDAGRLFFVGDPKQSIYRFRRADIDLYEAAQEVFARPPLHLTENFRSVASIVAFVNELFAPWMEDPAAIGQPAYTPLTPHVDDYSHGPTVELLGDEIAGVPTAEIRLHEADAVVRVVAQAKREGWLVRDEEHEVLRPAQYGDIAILMPTRASLPALDHGLDAAGIPLRVESRILIWNTPEVRDLLAVLSAVADPNDQVAIVAALRSAGLGCSDRDLATWRWGDERPRWRYRDIRFAAPDAQSHPVGYALTVLSDLHDAHHWLSIGEMVRRVVDVCHLRELAFAHVRPRDRWRRIDFFLAQARAFEEAGGASIEEFVAWARDQAERDVWENDSIEPDPDDDAVRVLTVHASKGLEFPIVVLMGLNAQPRSAGPPVLWTETGFEAKAGPQVGDRFETEGYTAALKRETALLKAERVRLAYVAMTRARDRLVVSRFRPDKYPSLAKEMTPYLPSVPTLDPDPLPARSPSPVAAFDHVPLSEREVWIEHREEAVARALVAPAVAATGIQHLAIPAVDMAAERDDEVEVDEAAEADERADDEPPWRRGRAGTAIGRAVHAVLQTVDLATGEPATGLAAAQAAAEGVPDLAEQIERRVRAVLESPSVREAVATDRYWREVFVAVPVGDRVLEGFIDLLYEDRDGRLVVIDYKTDGVRVDADADDAVARYRLQAAAYALAVSQSLARPVDRCVFVFANPTRSFERELGDLAGARAEVEQLLSG